MEERTPLLQSICADYQLVLAVQMLQKSIAPDLYTLSRNGLIAAENEALRV